MGRPDHIKAVLFDMDGTTIDSEPIKNEQLASHLRGYGVDIGAADLAFVSGMDLQGFLEAIQGLLDRFGVETRALAVLQSMSYGREEAYLHPGCKPVAGIEAFLDALRAHGIRCALVSNTPAYAVLTALDRFHLTSRFDAIIGGDMIAKHKPDPEGYLKAMELLCVEPSSCAVIEDSASGIAAGVAAGAYVLARDDGTGVQDLSTAHERFRSFADLVL